MNRPEKKKIDNFLDNFGFNINNRNRFFKKSSTEDTISETNLPLNDDEVPLIRPCSLSTNNLDMDREDNFMFQKKINKQVSIDSEDRISIYETNLINEQNECDECTNCKKLKIELEALNAKLLRFENILKISPHVCNWFEMVKACIETRINGVDLDRTKKKFYYSKPKILITSDQC